MVKELVIGLDIGTTSAKAVLFDIEGKIIAETEEMIETIHPEIGWAEQIPDDVERCAKEALKNIIKHIDPSSEKLLGVGFSCAMHSLLCLDDKMAPLSNVIIWSDGRSSEQADKLNKAEGKTVYLNTGTPIHPMSPFVKLVWMDETNYEAKHEATYFVSMKEYILWKWFKQRVVDYSMASATGLFNINTYQWDKQALALANIKEEQLSEIVSPETILAKLDKQLAREIGLSEDVPFVIGAADGQLANLGDGAIEPGEVAISVGTSGAIRQFAKGAPINPNRETFTYAFANDTSIIGGPTNNGGIALQWLKEILNFDGDHAALIAKAENVPTGADGLIFLPYVNGERAPVWNQRAKGNFFGLQIEHRDGHLVKAVLEGIALNLYHISQSLEKVAGEPNRICVNGGLAKSELWVQILADIFGKDVHLSETHHGAAWGAAWTALVGVGKVQSYQDIKQHIAIKKVIQPNQSNHERYQQIFAKFVGLSKDIAKYF
ncbi:gluconokinase [Aquibacillus salsiterrae]|uniref:Gluconokinase n=1 Tax=Aquibacillus salsiterrae TaxID=2950439 RepID=A0A9X3WCX5_9BACI|nr:gluconokinase [Aquibacillus salsiterrae]MDC3416091.1 gluconokinase [Aquibacillus salsiterrae]